MLLDIVSQEELQSSVAQVRESRVHAARKATVGRKQMSPRLPQDVLHWPQQTCGKVCSGQMRKKLNILVCVFYSQMKHSRCGFFFHLTNMHPFQWSFVFFKMAKNLTSVNCKALQIIWFSNDFPINLSYQIHLHKQMVLLTVRRFSCGAGLIMSLRDTKSLKKLEVWSLFWSSDHTSRKEAMRNT